MLKVIAIAKALMALLPIMIELVKVVEAQFPQAGQGAAKLAMVRQMLEAAVTAGSDIGVSFDDIWPKLQGVVGSIVAVFNTTGAFKK